MYERHPEFRTPSIDATLWRYIDFIKFVSLLDKEALFFSRLDRLGDPFEGSVSRGTLVMRHLWLEDAGISPERIQETLESLTVQKGSMVRKFLVNCWHENDGESEAMWKLYGGESGIAIKTTFEGLSQCFRCETDIFIGNINYVDYDTTIISEANLFTSSLKKRKSFEHEREVRVVANELGHDYEVGNYFEVDLNRLIHQVVVAPQSPEWFVNLVKSVTARYDIDVIVSESSMDVSPVW